MSEELSFLKSANELQKVEVIPTSIASVNDIVFACGGIPRGRVIEIFAMESQGKSTFAQWLVGEVQKQGLKAAWADAERTFDKDYAKGSGVNIDELQMIDFSTGNDLLYKLKLLFAMDLFDIVVLDSINSVVPDTMSSTKLEDFSMNEKLAPARMWSGFFRSIEGGYTITNVLTGKPIRSNKITKIIDEVKLIEKETDLYHKISDKKVVFVLINHKQTKVGVQFGQKWYTPGGTRKNFIFSIRLDITRKKTDTGQVDGVKGILKHRIIAVKALKNKVGVPLGTATLKMDKSGMIYPLDDKDLKVLEQVNLVDEIEKVDGIDILDSFAAKLEGLDE